MPKRRRANPARYVPAVKYTEQELADALRADLLNDAECAERQAVAGPFYPSKGITRESLLAYAAECRHKAKGGANA